MAKEIKASAILLELINVRIAQLIQRGAEEAGLPAGANLDIGRGVWVVPDEKSNA